MGPVDGTHLRAKWHKRLRFIIFSEKSAGVIQFGTTRTLPSFPNKAGGPSYLCAMRNTEQIREYYRQATECAQQADAQMDPKVKQQFLVLARLWLILADCFELKPRTNLSGKP